MSSPDFSSSPRRMARAGCSAPSAHQLWRAIVFVLVVHVIDPMDADALSKLGTQYAALYRTEDFLEGRRAEAEGRPPKYKGR